MNSLIQKEKIKKEKEIINSFANELGLRILNFKFSTKQERKKNCCLEEEKLIVYQKEDRSLGKIRFCCQKKLTIEIKRVSKLLQKTKRSQEQIYNSSYKLIRGSVGQILLRASFGINMKIYLRESKLIEKFSILRNIEYLFRSCSIEEWNLAIAKFQKNPCEKSVKRIIKLYSPLFRDDNLLVCRMTKELVVYLTNIFKKWNNAKKRVVYSHLGVGIVINDILVNFKFTEHKLNLQKTYFEDLYRNYRSICRANSDEKEKIKEFAIFSPITGDFLKLEIKKVISKWQLEKNFSRNFTLWQLKSYINISKNNIFIADRFEQNIQLAIETKNPFFKKLNINKKDEK